jgi:uncharacterized repeat protein (TIGR03803 family)
MYAVTLAFLLAIVAGLADVASAQEDFVVLKHFISAVDGSPLTGLTKASDGNLYGALNGGGIYRWTRDGTYTRISDAGSLYGMVQGTDGYLYGTTQSVIYRIALTGEFTELAVFSNSSIDGLITGSIVEGDDGNFYGISKIQSFEPAARIFKVTPSGVVSTAHQFVVNHAGYVDLSSMTKGRDGYFYGTTSMGGFGNYGTIFRFHPDGSYTTLHSFTGLAGGARPQAPLLETDDGTFYGTTGGGGIGRGTIFRFRPGAEFTVIHAFQEVDGSLGPRTPLIAGSDGYLYGAGEDLIYRVSTAGDFKVLHRVTGDASARRWGNGYHGVVEWFDGNFYGTGRFNGASTGVLFRLNRERSACANELNLAYQDDESMTLRINHVFKTESAAIGGLFFVSQYGVSPIWRGVLAPITPAVAYEIPVSPFPAMGTVGVFSFAITSGLQTCSDWTTVETGGPAIPAAVLQQHIAEYVATLGSPRK